MALVSMVCAACMIVVFVVLVTACSGAFAPLGMAALSVSGQILVDLIGLLFGCALGKEFLKNQEAI